MSESSPQAEPGAGPAASAYRWLQWPCLLAILVFAAADQVLPRVGHVAQIVFILPALVLLVTGAGVMITQTRGSGWARLSVSW